MPLALAGVVIDAPAMADAPPIREGQAPPTHRREDFHQRFMQEFFDPAFDAEHDAITRLEQIAWEAYQQGRKAPRTAKAGPGFANTEYQLSTEWSAARARLQQAQARWADRGAPSRALIVCGSSRNDGTCPGEMSKTFRLSQIARQALEGQGIECDMLDLSLLVSDYKRRIYPCKGCVSTAMPLCHWPCSCYPNHATGQTGDWMNEIYERWVAAHGVLLLTPVYWYQAASPLKLMIDRLVCADGGNPDPTLTRGKDAARAKQVELDGWGYPKHLAGRAYGVIVHGDVAGTEAVRRALSDWLDWMGLVDAGAMSQVDRYINYYGPYATSHEALDEDTYVQHEVRNAALALGAAIQQIRTGQRPDPAHGLRRPRPK